MTLSNGFFFLWLDMPTVLRLVYSRFAAQETLSDKLEDPEDQDPPPVGHEYAQVEDTPEMGTDLHADQLINKPAVDL
jgi:hypothetical protein